VYVDATPLLTRGAITGDVSVPQASNTATLATVNSNVGAFGSASAVGTFTVNGKGLVTAAANATISIDHGSQVTGLSDDDHSLYVLQDGTRTATKLAAGSGDYLQIGAGATASAIRFMEPSGSGTHYSAFKAQAQAGNVTYTLPAADATVSGYALKSDAAGALSWGPAGGEELKKSITQASHGFAVQDVVYYTGSTWAKADASAESTAEAIGIVSAAADVNTFTVLYSGYIDTLSGLVAGTVYFLSETAGALTATEPTTAGAVSKPLLVMVSATAGYVFNWRGQVIGGGVAGVREITSGTATAGQTTLTVAYTPGYVDVYVNGVRLLDADFTATNGTSIVLDTGMALNDEWVVVVWTVTSTALLAAPTLPGGRLTLTSGTPVMSADAAAQTTIYYTPYVGDLVPCYDGSSWAMKRFAEVSIAMAANAAWAVSSNFDLYIYNDGGTIRLVTGAAWTNATTRSESLTRVNGILTNTASMTGRYATGSTVTVAANRGTYVGTFRTTGSTGTTTWVAAPAVAAGGTEGQLYLWNCYNRVAATGVSRDSTDSWTYSTAAWHSYNTSATNRVSYVVGLADDPIFVLFNSVCSAAAGESGITGVGIDSTGAISGCTMYAQGLAVTGGPPLAGSPWYAGQPGIGYHFAQALEYGNGVGAQTFYGDATAPTLFQTGISLRGMF
jgi:hypothetical protein